MKINHLQIKFVKIYVFITKGRFFLPVVKVNQEVNHIILHCDWSITRLTSKLALTCSRKMALKSYFLWPYIILPSDNGWKKLWNIRIKKNRLTIFHAIAGESCCGQRRIGRCWSQITTRFIGVAAVMTQPTSRHVGRDVWLVSLNTWIGWPTADSIKIKAQILKQFIFFKSKKNGIPQPTIVNIINKMPNNWWGRQNAAQP